MQDIKKFEKKEEKKIDPKFEVMANDTLRRVISLNNIYTIRDINFIILWQFYLLSNL